MTNRLAVLLAYIVASEAARYGDYSGAQMPHFGIAYENKESALTDEYPDRSPDAPAAFDYKYEEEPKNKIQEDEDSWHKSEKRLKPVDDKEDIFYSDEQDIIPRYKSNRRFLKHRPRTKNVYKENKRKPVEYDDSRNEELDELDNNAYVNKQRSRDNNRLDLDNFDYRYTTRRLARRKPRDRTLSGERLSKNIEDNEFGLKIKETNGDPAAVDYEGRGNPHTTLERTRPPYLDLEKIKNNNYPEYEDTIRFNTIRNKLPGLFRQTKASASTVTTPSTRLLQDITFRRVNILEKLAETNFATEAIPSLTTSESLVTTASSTKHTIDLKEKSPPSTTSEISLAEKSRLSIMKKAQKKEGLKNVTRTTKPPVLMQVTKNMQTVVMIESPNRDLNLRARDTFVDSPEKINRAKKLMRHKLVAGARSFHDLIDNWDELVCDYIDTSLLENGCNRPVRVIFNIILLSAMNYLIANRFV